MLNFDKNYINGLNHTWISRKYSDFKKGFDFYQVIYYGKCTFFRI